MADYGRLRFRAEIIVAGQALVAVHAATGIPADPYPLPDLQSLDIITGNGHSPHHFVAGYERILGQAPVVVEDRQIRMAKTAIFDNDLNLLSTEGTGS